MKQLDGLAADLGAARQRVVELEGGMGERPWIKGPRMSEDGPRRLKTTAQNGLKIGLTIISIMSSVLRPSSP